MALQPTKLNATYQDIETAPAHMRAELLDGRLYLQPRPRMIHQHALVELWSQLRGSPRSEGWVFLPEVELHFGEDVLVPDIAGWKRERFTEGLDAAYATVAPDWVCEVLSPSTRKYDAGDKRMKYLRAGVSALWEVDPVERTIEVYGLESDRYVWRETAGGDEGARLWPFFDVALELSRFWGLR